MKSLRYYYEIIVRPHGIFSFLNKYSARQKSVLDVGCGKNSAFIYKRDFPDIYYYGLDIVDYNNKSWFEDELTITNPKDFANKIGNLENLDLVISKHNLEHFDVPNQVLENMCKALSPQGKLFLAFPSSVSVYLPSRKNTLNYFDDLTHKKTPPDLENIVNILEKNDCKVIHVFPFYRPLLLRIIGLLQEPLSIYYKKVMQGTWAYHGFETVIWVSKK
jgi:SAM-dependent methyltransferase